ncbi:Hypothetical protein PHPALM_513 [Phytophthora palmivora]|uniref:Reverse transcriptase RNase H-like domain-containing protein n=1 Tax=Phytophthora palmivora TaxID=4796 RepID=A0A2P4YUR3_9STRA|nr:Hypothetical protein PHPALM_513 [Phytophthora palmivora]
MFVRGKGFHVYCDHSNHIQIFTPDRETKQHFKGKLQRVGVALLFITCRRKQSVDHHNLALGSIKGLQVRLSLLL